MSKPMMLQDLDAEKIDELKKRSGAKTKIEVVRAALRLLENDIQRLERIIRWKRAAHLARATSYEVLNEFQPHSRLGRHD